MSWPRWLRRTRGMTGNGAAGRDDRADQDPAAVRQAGAPSDTGPSPESRQRVPQVNIRGDAALIARFRALCRAERRTYADMLRVLIDAYEARGRRD